MDKLHAMSAFAAVVDAGGFAGAARRLGLSPPAVTRDSQTTRSTVTARQSIS